jgi:predicted dienelactone hydrolase
MKRVLKIAGALLGVVVLAGAGMVAFLVATAARPARPVGVQQVLAADPEHAPVAVTIFYPTTQKPRLVWSGLSFAWLAPKGAVAGQELPLVVVSHGTTGASTSHLDTALALAEAGYVVAAPMHVGDNFQDPSAVGTDRWIVDRAREVARVNDFMLGAWADHGRIDPRRVGVFGHSAGGTTALIAVGGTPDLARVGPHCAAHPEIVCKLMKPKGRTPAAQEWTHDGRIRAAVVVAPGFGFAFAPDGLAGVRAPVQLWAGEADTNVPLATNAGLVRSLLPRAPEFHLVPGAGHAAFLAPCGAAALLLPKMVCADPKGFDRTAFHRQFNKSVVAFFDRSLSAPGGA